MCVYKKSICIYCEEYINNILKNNIDNNQYNLYFQKSKDDVISLSSEIPICCFIVQAFQLGICRILEIREIAQNNPTFPILIICSKKQINHYRECLSLNYAGYDIIFEENLYEISFVVDSIIQKIPFLNDFNKHIMTKESISSRVEQALDYIHNWFPKIKNATDLCKNLDIPLHSFRKEFKQTMEIPFHQYLIMIKLYYAVFLGQNKDRLSKEIAFLCGFQNEFDFYHLFKRKLGIPYSDFRNNKKLSDFFLLFH